MSRYGVVPSLCAYDQTLTKSIFFGGEPEEPQPDGGVSSFVLASPASTVFSGLLSWTFGALLTATQSVSESTAALPSISNPPTTAARAGAAVRNVTAGTMASIIAAVASTESNRRGIRCSTWNWTIGHPCRLTRCRGRSHQWLPATVPACRQVTVTAGRGSKPPRAPARSPPTTPPTLCWGRRAC